MSSLFELTGDYLALVDLAAETGAEEDQAFLDTLEGLTGEIEQKADSYCYVMSSIDSQIAAVEKEIDRLDKIKAALTNHKDAVKRSIFNAMKAMDMPEIKTDLHKLKIQKNGGKLPLILDKDESDIPDKYLSTKTYVDKEKIRADLDSGIELAFAHLAERGEHLRIS